MILNRNQETKDDAADFIEAAFKLANRVRSIKEPPGRSDRIRIKLLSGKVVLELNRMLSKHL